LCALVDAVCDTGVDGGGADTMGAQPRKHPRRGAKRTVLKSITLALSNARA